MYLTRKQLIDAVGAGALLSMLDGLTRAAIAAEVAPMKLVTGRYGAVAFAAGDAIYVAGGCSKNGFQGDAERIHPASGAVTTLDVTLLPRRFHAAAANGSRVYIVGGDIDGGVTNAVECWDTATGKVEALPPMPTARRGHAAVIRDNFLFAIGGSARNVPVGAFEIYDIERKTWSSGPAMPMPRECTACLLHDRIFVPGGYDFVEATSAMHIYIVEQGAWVTGPSLPKAVSANHAAGVGNVMVSCGDYSRKGLVLAFNTLRGQWQPLPDYTPARHAAVVAFDRRIYAIGGNVDPNGSYLDTIQIIQPPV